MEMNIVKDFLLKHRNILLEKLVGFMLGWKYT